MTINDNDQTAGRSDEHISEVRSMLLDQMRALRRSPDGEALKTEIQRARAVSEVAQTIISTARVEVDYINAVNGASESPFLHSDEASAPRIPRQPQSPLPAPDDPARLGGPRADHPWRGSVTRHRLVG